MATAKRIERLTKLAADTSAYPFDLFGDSYLQTEQNIDEAVADLGLPYIPKTPRSIRPDHGTVVPWGIKLPVGFDDRPVERRSRLKVHEFTHVLDWNGKPLRWYANYARPWGRVIAECRGYGAGNAFRLHMGQSRASIKRRVEKLPDHLLEGYLIRRTIKRQQLCQVVLDGLFEALDL